MPNLEYIPTVKAQEDNLWEVKIQLLTLLDCLPKEIIKDYQEKMEVNKRTYGLVNSKVKTTLYNNGKSEEINLLWRDNAKVN